MAAEHRPLVFKGGHSTQHDDRCYSIVNYRTLIYIGMSSTCTLCVSSCTPLRATEAIIIMKFSIHFIASTTV